MTPLTPSETDGTSRLSKAGFKALVAMHGSRKLQRVVFPPTCKVCGKPYKGADGYCSVLCYRTAKHMEDNGERFGKQKTDTASV